MRKSRWNISKVVLPIAYFSEICVILHLYKIPIDNLMPLDTTQTAPSHQKNNSSSNLQWVTKSHTHALISMDTPYSPLTLDILKQKNRFTQSIGLPENNHTQSEYISPINWDSIWYVGRLETNKVSYSFKPERSNKVDFLDANIGWKFHLNVMPEHTKKVTQYLIENWYNHKYFLGGEVDDGKVYTIYIWSRHLAEKCASSIHRDIWVYLAMPKSMSEIEFRAGIVGRFVAMRPDDKYDQYGTHGLVHLIWESEKSLWKTSWLFMHIEHLKKLQITEKEFNEVRTMLKDKKKIWWRMWDIAIPISKYMTYNDMLLSVYQNHNIKEQLETRKRLCRR